MKYLTVMIWQQLDAENKLTCHMNKTAKELPGMLEKCHQNLFSKYQYTPADLALINVTISIF